MKRILILSPFFYPHVGGSQQYMEDIYSCMVKKYPQIQADVLCYKTVKTSSFEQYRGMNIYRLSGFQILSGQFILPNPIALFRFIFRNWSKYDLIHCNTRFFDSSWWAPVLAKLTGKKIIITDHCANSPTHENKFIDFVSKIIDRTVAGFFLRFYDRVFTTNKAAQKFLKQTFDIQSSVIYGGVNTDVFQPTVIPARRFEEASPLGGQAGIQSAKRTWIPHQVRDDILNGRNDKRIKILYSARMIPSKGARELFEAAKGLKNADFVFAGPGPLVEVLRREVKEHRLSHIKILGGKSKEEVARLIAGSDIFVHPSNHHEGFPNALLEAGASKIAVVATDMGGSKEIVINDKTGLLIKPNDIASLTLVLNRLMGDKSLRQKLSENLYEHVLANFTWEKAGEEMYGEICELI